MSQIYFIRHSQSTNNALWGEDSHEPYLVDRESDPDLTSVGEEQAKLLAEFLNKPQTSEAFDPQNRFGFGLTHLYCSLMLRAVKTGMAISQKINIPLVAWPQVHETGGVFDIEMTDGEPTYIGKPGPGKSFFKSKFPALVIPEDISEEGWWNRASEPRDNYKVRGKQIAEELLEKHAGTDHRVGIVTHGGIFTRILSGLFDIQAEDYWLLMNNCAISRVDVDEDRHIMLTYLNKVDFLPDHLIT